MTQVIQKRFVRIGARVFNLNNIALIEWGQLEILYISLTNGERIELNRDEAKVFWKFMENSAPDLMEQESLKSKE